MANILENLKLVLMFVANFLWALIYPTYMFY